MPLEVGGLTELAKTHDLVVVESVLEQACEQYPELWDEMAAIRVFARCSPQGKARVIRAIQAKSKQNHGASTIHHPPSTIHHPPSTPQPAIRTTHTTCTTLTPTLTLARTLTLSAHVRRWR